MKHPTPPFDIDKVDKIHTEDPLDLLTLVEEKEKGSFEDTAVCLKCGWQDSMAEADRQKVDPEVTYDDSEPEKLVCPECGNGVGAMKLIDMFFNAIRGDRK